MLEAQGTTAILYGVIVLSPKEVWSILLFLFTKPSVHHGVGSSPKQDEILTKKNALTGN